MAISKPCIWIEESVQVQLWTHRIIGRIRLHTSALVTNTPRARVDLRLLTFYGPLCVVYCTSLLASACHGSTCYAPRLQIPASINAVKIECIAPRPFQMSNSALTWRLSRPSLLGGVANEKSGPGMSNSKSRCYSPLPPIPPPSKILVSRLSNAPKV